MTTVRVNNGRVEEFENGSIRRTFGSNIVSAATDGRTVVAVTRSGRVETYVNGSIRQTFGSNAVSAQVSGDTVAVQTSAGALKSMLTDRSAGLIEVLVAFWCTVAMRGLGYAEAIQRNQKIA